MFLRQQSAFFLVFSSARTCVKGFSRRVQRGIVYFLLVYIYVVHAHNTSMVVNNSGFMFLTTLSVLT